MFALSMGWRRLLFASWPVEPAILAPHLPDALAVDTYDGQAWLSVVPFTNVDVRPRVLPRGIGLPLPELNLRTYVTCGGVPGVYFHSLDAQGVAAVLGARLLHHLPYYYARIDLDVEPADGDDRVRFSSRRLHPGARPARFEATYGPTGPRLAAERGSLAAFLTERHRYYAEAPDGAIRYAEVHHGRWPLYPATAAVEANTLFRANGFDHPDGEPVLYYSPGVDTLASPSRRLAADETGETAGSVTSESAADPSADT